MSYYQRSTGRVYHSKIGCSQRLRARTPTPMMRYSTNNGASWTDCGRPAQPDLRGPPVARRRQYAELGVLRQHLRHLAQLQPAEGRPLDQQLLELVAT